MAEIEQFLAAFPASKTGVRNRALFALMCFSGLRIQEALDLALADVHLDGDVPGVRVRCRDGRERMRLLHPKGCRSSQPGSRSDLKARCYFARIQVVRWMRAMSVVRLDG